MQSCCGFAACVSSAPSNKAVWANRHAAVGINAEYRGPAVLNVTQISARAIATNDTPRMPNETITVFHEDEVVLFRRRKEALAPALSSTTAALGTSQSKRP